MTQVSLTSTQELLMQRLGLLHALADSLEQAQAALATVTPEKLDHHTARQEELCRQLHALAAGLPNHANDRPDAGLADDLQGAARRVAELDRRYGALLRRRRRTVDIFCRVLTNAGTTYPAPKPPVRPNFEGSRSKG